MRKAGRIFTSTLFILLGIILPGASLLGAEAGPPKGKVPSLQTTEIPGTGNAPTFRAGKDGPPLRPNHPPIESIPPLPMPEPSEQKKAPIPADADTMIFHDAATGLTGKMPSARSQSLDFFGRREGYSGADGGGGSETVPASFFDMYKISDVADYPWRMNCKLVMRFGSNWFVASGVMIDAETVLTAGHCVNEGNGGNWADEIWVYPGYDGSDGGLPPSDTVGAYGWGYASYFATLVGWSDSGDFDYDLGVIRIDRAVGILTGWFGSAWGGDCAWHTSSTYNNASYPAESCPDPGLHNGLDMYYWYGNFDSCPGNQLQMITGGGNCFDTLWGGMSGSGAYYIDGDNRYVHAVASTSNRNDIGNYCRMRESWFNYIYDTFVPDTRGTTFDLQALNVNVEPYSIQAGSSTTLLDHLATNPTDADVSENTYYFSIYLSTDSHISMADTFLGTQYYTWDFDPMSSVRLNMAQVTIPADTPEGNYWIGVIYEDATDGDPTNNTTNGWDAGPIHVDNSPSHCYSCPDHDYGPFTPTGSWQTHSDSYAVDGCRIYQFNLTAGTPYRFTTCDGGGSYSNDTYFELYDDSCTQVAYNDDSCGLGSEIVYVPATSGSHYLKIRGYLGSAGNYTVAYIAEAGGEHCYACPSYDYGPFTPTGSWQTHSDSYGIDGCRIYGFDLAAGNVYTFTTCEGGGSFTGDTVFELYDNSCTQVAYNDDTCDFGSAIVYAPVTSGYHYLRIRGYGGSAGTYTVAYNGIQGDSVIRIDPLTLTIGPGGGQAFSSPGGGGASGMIADLPSLDVGSMDLTGVDPAVATLIFNPKLVRPQSVLGDFIEGKSKARIMVSLQQSLSADRSANPKDANGWATLRGEAKNAQAKVIAQLDSKEVTITNTFTYLFGFSAEVSLQGLEQLVANKEVASIEKDEVLHAHLAQGIPLMNASAVRGLHNGAGISIAICDTGIDYRHPMLGAGSFPNSKVIGGYDCGDDDSDPMDLNGHGTSCAGIAAGALGATGDYIGGVAYGAKLYAVKIALGSTGSANTSDMIEGWEWCITHQHDDPNNPIMIISTSFGGGRNFGVCDNVSPLMTSAAANAVAAGITVFASSGNDGYCNSMGWPACISHVVSVGAVYDAAFGTYEPCVSGDSCADRISTPYCSTGWYAQDQTAPDMVTSYSNVASFLDILAPSNAAYTTDISGEGGYTTGDYTSTFGGTSAACPYAAGAAACLQSAEKDINGAMLSPDAVRSRLIATGEPITDSKVAITKPRVNLEAAIGSAPATFTIHNDGNLPLEITNMRKRDGDPWLDFSPKAPFTLLPGEAQLVAISVDWDLADNGINEERIIVESTDADLSPYPNGVFVYAVKSSSGDCDGDGDVDGMDLYTLMGDFGGPGCDLNDDGVVDEADLGLFAVDFGKSNL